jgi:Predicted membrane protein
MQPASVAPFVLTYLLLNVAVFLIYGWDKRAAAAGTWRVRESTLLTLAFVGGSFGAVLAQRLLRHKTRKEPFRTILALIASLHVGVATFLAGLWALAPEAIAFMSPFQAFQ